MSSDDKTVLVTGATGLLGRQVVRAFERRQWRARGTGLSRADGAQVLRVDLGSAAEVEKALDEVRWAPPPPLIAYPAAYTFIRRAMLPDVFCFVFGLLIRMRAWVTDPRDTDLRLSYTVRIPAHLTGPSLYAYM